MNNIGSKIARRLTLAILTGVVLAAGAFTAKVSAQSGSSFEIQVPFEFVVMGRTYPAARYRIGRLSQANPDTLVLKTSAGKTLLVLQTQRLSAEVPARVSTLTFSQYGETHFLDSIRASGQSYENRLPSTRLDRRRNATAQAVRKVTIAQN